MLCKKICVYYQRSQKMNRNFNTGIEISICNRELC